MRRSRRGRPRNAPSRDARRDQLLAAAITAIRRDGPTISMARIAQEAGLTKPVVYDHFGDRAGLATAIAQHTTEELMSRIADSLTASEGLENAIRSTLATFVDFAEREPELFAFLLHPGGSKNPNAEIHALIQSFAGYIEPLAALELEPAGIAPGEVALRVRAILGLSYTTVDWWLREGRDDFTSHGIVERLTALVMAILEAG